MKFIKKSFVLAGLLFVLLCGSALAVNAASYIYQKQTAATQTSITVSWDSVQGVNHYKLKYWPSDGSESSASYVTLNGNTTSHTFNNLKNAAFKCNVSAYSSSNDDTLIAASYWNMPLATTPGKVALKAIDWGIKKGGTFKIKGTPPATLSGFEYKITGNKNHKVYASGTSTVTGISASSLPLTQTYTIWTKGYVSVDGVKFYGPPKSATYVPEPKMAKLKLLSGSRIKCSWKKVAGAQKYIVYVSTSASSGYKKVATLKSSKNSYVLSKFKGKKLKKYQNYYFKVCAVKGKQKSIMPNYSYGYIYTVYK